MARNPLPLNIRASRGDSLIGVAAVIYHHMVQHESASPIAARAIAIVAIVDMGIDGATQIVDTAMQWIAENPPPPPRHQQFN